MDVSILSHSSGTVDVFVGLPSLRAFLRAYHERMNGISFPNRFWGFEAVGAISGLAFILPSVLRDVFARGTTFKGSRLRMAFDSRQDIETHWYPSYTKGSSMKVSAIGAGPHCRCKYDFLNKVPAARHHDRGDVTILSGRINCYNDVCTPTVSRSSHSTQATGVITSNRFQTLEVGKRLVIYYGGYRLFYLWPCQALGCASVAL